MRLARCLLGTSILVGFVSFVGLACSSFEADSTPIPDDGDGGPTPDGGGPCLGCDAASADPAVEIAAGTFGCAVRQSGRVACWGDNTNGSIGVDRFGDDTCPGTARCRPIATEVVGITDAKQISVGGDFACALTRGGSVMCWGANRHATLGTAAPGPSSFEAKKIDLPPALEVTAGQWSACARVEQDGNVEVYCWGNKVCGELAIEGGGFAGPTKIDALRGAKAIRTSTTSALACAIDADDNVQCWGSNALGGLGHAPGSNGDTPKSGYCAPSNYTPARIGTPELEVVELAVTSEAACAKKSDGSVHCWGSNERGNLGQGTQDDKVHATPVRVAGVDGASALTGSNHLCMIDAAGTLQCWGSNGFGELANGFAGMPCFFGVRCTPTPGPASALEGVTRVAAGVNFTLAISRGEVYAWGQNNKGQLGHPPNTMDDQRSEQCSGNELCNSEPRLVRLP